MSIPDHGPYDPSHCEACAKMNDTTKLWAIHVEGPDTIIAQPDKETAEQRAKQWQEAIDAWIAKRPANPYDPVVKYVVVPYPGRRKSWLAQIAEHGGDPEDHA